MLRLPGRGYSIAATPDGRYIYFLGNTVYVYDTHVGKKVQTLPRLGNAMLGTSPDGRFLGCIHPRANTSDAVLYRVGEPHEELFRVPLKGRYLSPYPCFTWDGDYMLAKSGFPLESVWAVDTSTGKQLCIYTTPPGYYVDTISTNQNGIIITVAPSAKVTEGPVGMILYYTDVHTAPREVEVARELCSAMCSYQGLEEMSLHFCSIGDEKFLLHMEYPYRIGPQGFYGECRFQLIDTNEMNAMITAPDVIMPYRLWSRPKISTCGQYAAFERLDEIERTHTVCVYYLPEWKMIWNYTSRKNEKSDLNEMIVDFGFLHGTDMFYIASQTPFLIRLSEMLAGVDPTAGSSR